MLHPRPLQKQKAYHWRSFTPANNQTIWPLQWWIIAPAFSLKVAYWKIDQWGEDKDTKKYVEKTNHDVLALEFVVFTVSQAISMIEESNTDDDGIIDVDDVEYFDDLIEAQKFVASFFDRHYDQVTEFFNDRIRIYSGDQKSACESFAFHLCGIRGAQDFSGLKSKVKLDLETHLKMAPRALAYRKTMVPAFIESVERLIHTHKANF